jgi:hypothetical protein
VSTIITLIIIVFIPTSVFASCNKDDICKMVNKMSPFSILDRCPESAPFISQCKTSARLIVNELPKPEFVGYKDGSVEDLIYKLL